MIDIDATSNDPASLDGLLPIDLKTKLFDKSNTWVIVGLPNTECQYIESLRRGGVGAQSSPQDYFDTITFVEKSYPKEHPLYGARFVKPETDQDGRRIARAQYYQCYTLRRRQLLNLRAAGLKVRLGATKADFITAANAAFSNNGLLSVLTHFEASQRLEFADGFLDREGISSLRKPSGAGLLHLSVCRGADELRAIKLSLGSGVWACAPFETLSASAALMYMIEFWTSVARKPLTLMQHLECAQRGMIEAGLLETSNSERSQMT